MRKIIVALVLSVFLLMPTWATAFDSTGFRFSTTVSEDNTWADDDDCHEFTWGSLGMFGRVDQTPNWYVEFEADIGVLSWKGEEYAVTMYSPILGHTMTTYRDKGSNTTLSLEGRVMLIKKFKYFHLGGGLGLAVLQDHHDIYHLTKDGFYGLITGKLRVPVSSKVGFDFDIDHMSSVFGEDKGVNAWKGGIYYLF